MAGVIERLEAFVLERFPFAVGALQRVVSARAPQPATREAWIAALENELRTIDIGDLPETTPGVAATARWKDAVRELLDAIDGFFAREAITASLTRDEKLEIMRGMVLMRALDNRLKLLYLQGDVKYGSAGVQGKGFRSGRKRFTPPVSVFGAGPRIATTTAAGAVTSSVRSSATTRSCSQCTTTRGRSG
jgi:hypothetical protein